MVVQALDGEQLAVPGFWCTVFMNSGMVSHHIQSEKDKLALRLHLLQRCGHSLWLPDSYLSDVRCVLAEDAKSFVLQFDFLPNPFFDNQTLQKT